MANFLRLIVCALLLLSSSAYAAFAPPAVYTWTGQDRPEVTFSSADATCSDQIAYRNSLGAVGFTWEFHSVYYVSGTFAYCNANKRWGDGSLSEGAGSWTMGATVAYVCPSNSTGTSSCECSAGYQEAADHQSCEPAPPEPCPPTSTRVNGVCVPDPDCPAGQVRVNGQCRIPPKCPVAGTSAGTFDSRTETTKYTCEDGCMVKHVFDIALTFGDSGRMWYSDSKHMGIECNTGGDTSTGTGAGTGTGTGGTGTGSGTGTGTGNTGGGSGPAPQPTSPGSAPPPPMPQPPEPDGSCPAGTYKSAEGSCIKNPEPPDDDGVCPTGSVKVAGTCVYSEPGSGGGGGIGGGGGTGDGDVGGSGFGGNCAAGFACTGGDAIQCAIAKEQYIRNCKLFDDQSSAAAQLYLAATSAAPSNATDGLPGNEVVNLGPSRFDTTDALGGGSAGMSDLSVVVMGSSVTLPFSMINPYLAMLGNVLVGIAFILAARIVARG